MGDGYSRHTPELTGVNVVRAMSLDVALLPHLGDVIGNLANEWMWLEVGDSVDDIVSECSRVVDSWYAPMVIGQVSQFLGSLPFGWLPLDGTTFDEGDYPELWDLLDGQFKNEPASTFTLPDFGGLVLVAAGDGYVVGDDGGLVDVALSVAEMPSHDHTYIQPIANVDLEAPGVPDILAAGVGPGTTTGSTGGGESHENMMPYFAVVMGIFAGRE